MVLKCNDQIQVGDKMDNGSYGGAEAGLGWEELKFQIPSDLAEQLRAYCASRRVNPSLVMENMIAGYLAFIDRRKN